MASQSSPLVDSPPPGSKGSDYIHPTPFAGTYRSIYTLKATPELRKSLAHVNCSYLSKIGKAPTLTQLKQHAQSLVILIKNISVTTSPGIIDNANKGADVNAFNDGETFDFLNDLTKPYEGPDDPALQMHHNLSLTALLNLVMSQRDEAGHEILEDICPLHQSEESDINGPSMPYAQHKALVQHANEILEILDHEYSAKGGLLSILPCKDSQPKEREKAEATLLGQLILYVSRLVERLHDLERQYANAMDTLAGEASVPMQALSRLGPEGRKGRELVYPQDRFVLVNSGEDVWQYLNHEFEKKEAIEEKVAENYKKAGTTGEHIWFRRGGKEFSRGIVALDINTRYYRLRGDPLKTIFVIPAHGTHPGTVKTREMEKQPTVVTVVKPVWPERVSTWELKHRTTLEEYRQLKRKVEVLEEEYETAKSARDLSHDLYIKADYELRLRMEQTPESLKKSIHELNEKLDKFKREQAEYDAEKAAIDKQKEEVAAEAAKLAADRKAILEEDKRRQDTYNAGLSALAERDQERDKHYAQLALDIEAKLKALYEQQLARTVAVATAIQSTDPGRRVGDTVLTLEELKDAQEKAKKKIAAIKIDLSCPELDDYKPGGRRFGDFDGQGNDHGYSDDDINMHDD